MYECKKYYPATHQHMHQHYNNLQMQQQQQQQQQQQPHHEQTLVQAQHCNLHKGVVGKQHFPQQQQLVYQHQQKPQMRPDFSIQSQQQQQQQKHQQQYQNIGTWLPQNKTTPTTTTTTQLNGNIDDLNYHRHHEQHQPQKPYHHLHHQQQQPISYCAKRLDSNIANGRNSCLIEDIESDFIVGKTFITPPDIPSPPPQPIISENKRFQSGQTLSKTSAPTTATTSNTLINKTCCQCEGRLKNYQFTNHATPVVAQQQHNTSHCHIHHQPPTSQPQQQQQQKQQQQQQQQHSSQISAHHHNNLPHQYQTHLRQHSHHQHHQEQPNNEETLILPKATSTLKSQHYHSNQHQQQQQQQFHQPSSAQQHYRKVDVFATASLDDDDNDTSPSIKEQQNLKHNGWPYKPFPAKQDYELINKTGDENLSRGFSLESYNSLYEAELNGWSQQQQYSQQKSFAVASAVNRVNGIQHIMCNNERFETHLQQAEEFNVNAGHDNMDKMTLASNKKNKEILLPLDIPTPPLPLSYNINKRHLSSHNSNNTLNSCQCDKQTNFTHSNSTKNQVNHISIIQTTATNGLKTHYTHAQQHRTNPHPVTTKKENLTQMHNKESSSSSTLSAGSGSGGIGCGMGLNFNVSDQHLIQHAQEPLQHHHLCQQKNFKLQPHFSNYQHQATHLHQQQQQHHYQHRYQQQQKKQQLTQCHQQQQQQLQHKQLPSYDAYASQQYLPQLSLNSNNNSLSLSHRRMAPTFNRIADKNYMKNLVYSPEKLRRVRIILCVVGGLVLLALLSIALYFIISSSEDSSKDDNDGGPSNGMHLDDVIQGKLLAKHFNGSWSTDSNILYKENNAIMEYNVLTKQKTRLLLDTFQQYILYEKSADGTLLLLAKNYKKNFRHSFVAEYDIYDIESGVIKPLEIQKQAKHLIMVQWGPVGNALIINYERNLYYKPTAFADEIALTDDTNAAILNGIPDWVYEEEVFSSNSAVWFSPDGKKLAFIQFDDSPTHVINFPVYGEAGDLRFQYPFNRLVAYPKAGSPNPRVKLFTSDLDRAAEGNTDHLTNIPVPSALNTEGDYIITVVDWLNNTNVLSVWMNRIQNQAHVQIFNGLRRQKAYSLESKTGWVDFFSAPFKNRDGNRIAFIMPQAQDGYGEYRHLVVMSTASSNGKPEALTKGKFVVTSILHWDTTHDFIFYTANTESHPEHLHVYAIKAATGQTAKCLTCSLHTSNGVKQTYYSADFNANNQVILTSLGPSVPQTAIYELVYAGNQVSLKLIVFWEDNESLKMKLAKIDMPTTEIVNIPISDGFEAKVLLQLPPNMDRSGKTKYPLLVDVYGGPDSYSVVDKWIVDWGTYLSSNQSVIYAKIDGRGSGLRGEKLLHSVYLKLGTVEITDQIDVTRKLQQKYNFIDSNHTGIWGWSYGGYAAAMALANDNDHIFRCAASIAPVTDWAYYDSIYTERYMGLPAINELGYAASRLSTKAPQLKGKKFLLVHGTLDDNVHYQQAMILAKNLERHDILFKQISYPDEDHALAGVRPHLYHSLDRFFGDCFTRPRMSHSQ